jgi:hypothetical protein
MLYNLIKRYRGKDEIVMTDQLKKVNDWKKKISSSQRKGVKNQRVEYIVVKAAEDDNEKYKKSPHNLNLSGQPRRSGPPVIQKKRKQ